MTLNGRNALLAEINKNSGAHWKNFNEDRPISLVAKCRLMRILARNIKCNVSHHTYIAIPNIIWYRDVGMVTNITL